MVGDVTSPRKDAYMMGTCTTCGMAVEGTLDHFLSVHVPLCLQMDAIARTYFYRTPWPDGKGD